MIPGRAGSLAAKRLRGQRHRRAKWDASRRAARLFHWFGPTYQRRSKNRPAGRRKTSAPPGRVYSSCRPTIALNVSEAELAPVLKANFMQPVIQVTNNMLVVDTGGECLLVDTPRARSSSDPPSK